MKYSVLEITEELDSLLAGLRKDTSIVLLSELVDYKDYSSQTIVDWAREYKDNGIIQVLYQKINDLLIPRINQAVVDKRMDKAIASLALKSLHGWSDKRDISLSGGLTVVIPDIMRGV